MVNLKSHCINSHAGGYEENSGEDLQFELEVCVYAEMSIKHIFLSLEESAASLQGDGVPRMYGATLREAKRGNL